MKLTPREIEKIEQLAFELRATKLFSSPPKKEKKGMWQNLRELFEEMAMT